MPSKDIKVGLLAYGAIGDEHNKAILATTGLSLYAVCDTNPERLTAALQISPDAKTFTDADKMLAEANIDLVVISTPPNSHYKWAKQALSLGHHVMLEKPGALWFRCHSFRRLKEQSNKKGGCKQGYKGFFHAFILSRLYRNKIFPRISEGPIAPQRRESTLSALLSPSTQNSRVPEGSSWISVTRLTRRIPG